MVNSLNILKLRNFLLISLVKYLNRWTIKVEIPQIFQSHFYIKILKSKSFQNVLSKINWQVKTFIKILFNFISDYWLKPSILFSITKKENIFSFYCGYKLSYWRSAWFGLVWLCFMAYKPTWVIKCQNLFTHTHTHTHTYTYIYIWTPTYGRAKAGRPARTYIQQLCEDTGCSPEDLPEAMKDREEWREKVRDICIYIYIYMICKRSVCR